MNRRHYLKALAAAPAAGFLHAASPSPIQLHLDLEVEPRKEADLHKNFNEVFRPAISRQPGFVGVTLLKLRKEMAGKAPAGCSYRLILSFETEEQRQAWVATDTHQRAWPTIEATLTGAKYIALLYDPA
jgi:heme-degrading monooxygenase HmoA